MTVRSCISVIPSADLEKSLRFWVENGPRVSSSARSFSARWPFVIPLLFQDFLSPVPLYGLQFAGQTLVFAVFRWAWLKSRPR